MVSKLSKSDCLKIIEYTNDLLDTLACSFRYQNDDNFIDYYRKYYNLKSLFFTYVTSFCEDFNEDLD